MFLRPDFLNLTICLTAFFMLDHQSILTKNKFRVLVLALLLSIIYDLVWVFTKTSEYTSSNDSTDGSAETGLRKFSLLMSYASFILRVSQIFYNTHIDTNDCCFWQNSTRLLKILRTESRSGCHS